MPPNSRKLNFTAHKQKKSSQNTGSGRSNSVVGSASTYWDFGVVEIDCSGWRIKQEQDKKYNYFVLFLSFRKKTIHTTHESTLIWKYNDSESTLATHFIKYNDYESTLATHVF